MYKNIRVVRKIQLTVNIEDGSVGGRDEKTDRRTGQIAPGR